MLEKHGKVGTSDNKHTHQIIYAPMVTSEFANGPLPFLDIRETLSFQMPNGLKRVHNALHLPRLCVERLSSAPAE